MKKYTKIKFHKNQYYFDISRKQAQIITHSPTLSKYNFNFFEITC